jgi:hypothetical protein
MIRRKKIDMNYSGFASIADGFRFLKNDKIVMTITFLGYFSM